jgi:hypothetical protein
LAQTLGRSGAEPGEEAPEPGRAGGQRRPPASDRTQRPGQIGTRDLERGDDRDDLAVLEWNDAGVHQNITFPVHPDPISGMHCWHQKGRVGPPGPRDRFADIHVDFARARRVCRKWLTLARPASGELRRPIWLFRPVKPTLEAYRLPDDRAAAQAPEALPSAPRPFEFHTLVDWSPEPEWGAMP